MATAASAATAVEAVAVETAGAGAGVDVHMALDGDQWHVTWGRRAVVVRDLKGMHYLAELVRRPGRELHVTQLAGGAPADEPAPAPTEKVRARFLELRETIEEAEAHGNLERLHAARAELELLGEELLRSGTKRTPRPSASAERMRQSVTKRIREAIRKIHEQNPGLGSHLDQSVRTGTFCAYTPSSSWAVREG